MAAFLPFAVSPPSLLGEWERCTQPQRSLAQWRMDTTAKTAKTQRQARIGPPENRYTHALSHFQMMRFRKIAHQFKYALLYKLQYLAIFMHKFMQ